MRAPLVVTVQQRVNALSARDHMWPGVAPEEVVEGFGSWLSNCGTAGCFGWHCGQWAPFQAQGLITDPINGRVQMPGYGNASHRLFGDGSLFDERSDDFDPQEMTDHQVITWRLEQMIARSVVLE